MRSFPILIPLALALLAPCATLSASPATVIVGATVIHPERDGAAAVMADAAIVITGDRITSVTAAKDLHAPRGARVIDAHGKWVIPGLIDSHVHFFQSGNLYTRPDVIDLNAIVPYAQEVARNEARLPLTFKVWLA